MLQNIDADEAFLIWEQNRSDVISDVAFMSGLRLPSNAPKQHALMVGFFTHQVYTAKLS